MESDGTLKYPDFQLKSNDGNIHPCHRFALDNNSPVFKAMLEKDWAETNSGSMKVQDHDAQTVKDFIKYTHTPKAGSDIVEMARKSAQPGEHIFMRQFDRSGYAPDLLLMAHKYQVDDLQTDCIEHLSRNMSKDNVVESWMAGQTIGCTQLKTAAVKFLAQQFNMGNTSDFRGLYDSEKTLLLMEELHQYIFQHKQQDQDQEQVQKAMDILDRKHMQTAFVVACREGNLPLVNWMIDMPVDLGIPEGGRYNCHTLGFWMACLEGHLHIVNRLLDIHQHGDLKVDAAVKKTDFLPGMKRSDQYTIREDVTAFYVACRNGHSEVVKRLLELPAGTINFEHTGPNNFTGFLAACYEGNLSVVNLLLPVVNILAKVSDGANGFMMACHNGHLSVVKSFLELPQGRFNVDETRDGETGLDIAVRKGHQDIAAAINQYKRDNNNE